jgi:hypothetical protein
VKNLYRYMAAVFVLACCIGTAAAREYAPNSTGFMGLNTVPSARMATAGHVRIGAGFDDPYLHGYFGMQVAKPLYIGVRQSAENANPFESADRLYPGVDMKLRLMKETRSRPEIAVGLQSAIGHKRMAGEFIAASKRWKNFDFTFGLGWGRFAGKGHFDNPLKGISSHFGRARPLDGALPNGPEDWFTGRDMGLFGGVEYFTPMDGLSFKADIGADRYEAERAGISGYKTPAPWAVGVNYRTPVWHGISADAAVALHGFERIMARLNFNGNVKDWRDYDTRPAYRKPLYPHRAAIAAPGGVDIDAMREGVQLYHTRTGTYETDTHMAIKVHLPLPSQIGRAGVHMANNGGKTVERLSIRPTYMGLRGPRIQLNRSDLERAAAMNNGSSEELWQNTVFDASGAWSIFAGKLRRPSENERRYAAFSLLLDNTLSLAEEDSGMLYRSSFIGGFKGPRLFGALDTGSELRLNLADNLGRIRAYRPAAALPIRSDEDKFAERRVSLERSWLALTHSFKTDVHVSLMGGYLEEMYAGIGGEVLYRPFKSRFAVGVQAFQALKRDPYTSLNLGLSGDNVTTAHVNLWYDVPYIDTTAHIKIGQYLDQDLGITAGLEKTFNNGVRMEAFAGVTNHADYDLFGGTTHVYNGLRLTLPLSGFMSKVNDRRTYVAARFRFEPVGRDSAQVLDKPIDLYDATTPFSYKHISDHWWRVDDTP